jgi:hypothetical protein
MTMLIAILSLYRMTSKQKNENLKPLGLEGTILFPDKKQEEYRRRCFAMEKRGLQNSNSRGSVDEICDQTASSQFATTFCPVVIRRSSCAEKSNSCRAQRDFPPPTNSTASNPWGSTSESFAGAQGDAANLVRSEFAESVRSVLRYCLQNQPS